MPALGGRPAEKRRQAGQRGQGLWKGRGREGSGWFFLAGPGRAVAGAPQSRGSREEGLRGAGPSPTFPSLLPPPSCLPACFPRTPPPPESVSPAPPVPPLPASLGGMGGRLRHVWNPCSASSHLYLSLCLRVPDFNFDLDPSISASLCLSLPPSVRPPARGRAPPGGARCHPECRSPGRRRPRGCGGAGAGASGRRGEGTRPRPRRSPGGQGAGSAQTSSTWAPWGAPLSLPGPGGGRGRRPYSRRCGRHSARQPRAGRARAPSIEAVSPARAAAPPRSAPGLRRRWSPEPSRGNAAGGPAGPTRGRRSPGHDGGDGTRRGREMGRGSRVVCGRRRGGRSAGRRESAPEKRGERGGGARRSRDPACGRGGWGRPGGGGRRAGRAGGRTAAAGLGRGGPGEPGRGARRGATAFFAFSSSGSFRAIDTCAGPAPAANIFLMSSRGLERARSALQGGFSPGRCFGRRGRAGAPGRGDKSLPPRGEGRLSSKVQKKDGLSLGPPKCISRRTMGSFLRLRGPAGREGRGPGRSAPPGRLAPPLHPSRGG